MIDNYYTIIAIIVVILLLVVFALISEIACFKKLKALIPAWEMDTDQEKIRQLTSLACMGSDYFVHWRHSLIGAVIISVLLWALLYPLLSPWMVLLIGVTVFFITYAIMQFYVYHAFRPVCHAAREGSLNGHEVIAQAKGVHKVGDSADNLPPLKPLGSEDNEIYHHEAHSEIIEEICLAQTVTL